MSEYLMKITDQEFDRMRQLIYDRFGINLTEQKRSLLIGRLQKHIRSLGLSSFKKYYEHLTNAKSEEQLSQLVDRVTTNYTYFNRENDHFKYFYKTVLPEVTNRLQKEKRKDLKVWCAGCSSGEEAYMLLMLMQEFFGKQYGSWDAGILATDISNRALTTAKAGIYSAERVNNLPGDLKNKYLHRLGNGNWTVNEQLKREAIIRRFNLMNPTFPFKKQFQVIFCRNVMIYFDQPTRDRLIRKFHRLTEPGGYLFIGHSETLGRNHSHYRYLHPAVYKKQG
jgi:chemotaxis protein methyltransferase CheR